MTSTAPTLELSSAETKLAKSNYICSESDFWGRGPVFESGISHKRHNDPDTLQDHCVTIEKIAGKRWIPTPEAKKIFKKINKFLSSTAANRVILPRQS